MGNTYSIGLDFGTLSARGVIANVENGKTLPYESSFCYPHAILSELGGAPLPKNYALQHPRDYIDALEFLIYDLLKNNSVDKNSIIGIGIDFTDCTVLPVNEDYVPLCFFDEYKNEPHAYAKIWKHHTNEKYAQGIEQIALKLDPSILSVTGGRMTSEFLIPKLYETLCEAPRLYNDTYKFMLAGDFIAYLLSGNKIYIAGLIRQSSTTMATNFQAENFLARLIKALKRSMRKKLSLSFPHLNYP